MKTIFDEPSRSEILSRIDRLSTGAKPGWGKMNAEQMLAHLVESGRMTMGEVVCKRKKTPIRFFPIKQLILYVFPFPKGAPTARELLTSDPATLERSKSELARVLGAIAAKTSTDG